MDSIIHDAMCILFNKIQTTNTTIQGPSKITCTGHVLYLFSYIKERFTV